MYSGGDSSGDGVNSRNQFNWQMTSQTSCNVNSGSIDWASLAQQWIQMKDSGAGLPEAPPPPVISGVNSYKSIKQPTAKYDEQGEADMEVEKDDEMQVVGFGHSTPPPPPPTRWHSITAQQEDIGSYCPPQQNWNWPARVALPPPILHVPITTESLTPPIPRDMMSSTTPPLQKPHADMAAMLPSKGSLDNLPMDAAKRKILPAWIREGLEKMEREKLKQLERGTKDKDPSFAGTAAAQENDINNFKTMVKSSIMEMEGESSGNEEANDTAEPPDDTDNDNTVVALAPNMPTSDPTENFLNLNSGKTYEERIADMMIGVRKTLTELLLEVTNEEIISIANEAIRRRREKASSVQVIRKSAIPSITGKLGLEAYADSDSENSASDNDTTNDESKRSDDDYDSEEELKANIRVCQRAFLKTIAEIEDKIEATAVREELLLREHRKDETNRETSSPEHTRSPMQQKTKWFDKEIGEPLQPDKKSNSNGKRRKERTSRFSDNKDSRNRNMGTTFYQPTSMGSGNLPSQVMPGSAPILPTSNLISGEFKPRTGSSSLAAASASEKRSSSSSKSSKQTSSSTSAHNHRHSGSSTSSSDSSSNSTSTSHSRRSKHSSSRHKPSSRDRSKRSDKRSSHRSSSHRSSSHRSSRRRDSSNSNDDDRYSKKSSRRHPHKSHSSSKYSRKNDRRRSDSRSSRSRTRSRSRSRSTTYSSSRRGDRY